MYARFVLTTLLLSLALVISGCISAPTSAPTPTPDAAITIELSTSPDPLRPGPVEVIVTLTDAANQPIDNAQVSLIISHKGMADMDQFGLSRSQGGGRYTLTSDFSMAGDWQVTVEVRGVAEETIRKNFEISLTL